MKRFLIKLSLACCVFLAAGNPASAQPDHDVAYWLDRDTTLLININDVSTTCERIMSLDLFSNPRFLKAIQMLSDERFPVVDRESCDKILQRLYELEALMHKIDQFSIAVHQIDKDAFRWSLFVRAEAEVLDRIQAEMQGIDVSLKSNDSFKDGPADNAESNEVDAPPDDSGSEGVRWGKFQRTGGWLVLSNHKLFLNALPERIKDEKFRSLGKSRKYRAIQKRESPLVGSAGLITVYGNPVRMQFLIPHTDQADWDFGEIDELPACGLNLGFSDPGDEDAVQPRMLADAVIKFTQPAVGQAKIFQHYRAVEIPPLAVKPIELLAFARNEQAVAEEWNRIFEQNKDNPGDEAGWVSDLRQLNIDFWNDAVPRRNAFFELRFLDDQHPVDRAGLVVLEKLNDRDAAHRFAGEMIARANHQHQRKLDQQQDGSFISWTAPEGQFVANTGLGGFDRKRHERIDFFNNWHDAYVLTDDWWVQGDMPATNDQVNLLTTGEGPDHAQPIRELVEDLTRRLRAEGPLVMLKYYTADAWQENLNGVEQHYANANSRAMRFRLNVAPGNEGNTTFMLVPEEDDSPKPEKGSTPPTIKLNFNGAAKSNGNSKPSKMVISSLQNLQLMMPMQLALRNEDGHRIPLKRREDLEVAIRVMILKSLAETFPRQLFVYTRNDQHIRIMMGAYPEKDVEKNE